MIQPERIHVRNAAGARRGDYVLYWMQQAQRAEWNHALEFAVHEANVRRLPVVVAFGLIPDFPEANARHYRFMLEGLCETQAVLKRRGIAWVLRLDSPERLAVRLASRAALLITDRGYLRVQRQWRDHVAAQAACPVLEVESDAVVPVETATPGEEFSAATLRPKLRRQLARFLVPLPSAQPRCPATGLNLESLELSDVPRLLKRLRLDNTVGPAPGRRGGAAAALCCLNEFLRARLALYAESRRDPSRELGSELSPYLHFGQISALQVALAVQAATSAPQAAREAFLDELLVRRELSLNFVWYNTRYDTYSGLPDWARRTLAAHARDRRPTTYTPAELESARTHDPYWNAAQREMLVTGRMHGYMRMYWGKKIIEWSESPEAAFKTALTLNNRYELDGRDPNGFAGVAWCFGKHDRPWAERAVFGNVRYMNAAGLERKFDMPAYLRRVEALER
jgi:deoxyribodipyrimidine photo-lyase